jgi:hypothetical protein
VQDNHDRAFFQGMDKHGLLACKHAHRLCGSHGGLFIETDSPFLAKYAEYELVLTMHWIQPIISCNVLVLFALWMQH